MCFTDACSVVAEMDKTSSVKVQLAVLNLLIVNVLCTNSKSFSDEAVLLKMIHGFVFFSYAYFNTGLHRDCLPK